MEFEVLDETDDRLIAFLSGRHSESFLLNTLPVEDAARSIRVAALDSGLIVGVASISNGGLILQTNEFDQSDLVSAALRIAVVAKVPIDRVICNETAVRNVRSAFEASSVEAVQSTETATLFERELLAAQPVPASLSAHQVQPSDREEIARAIEADLQPFTDASAVAQEMAINRCAAKYWLLRNNTGEAVSLGGISEQAATTVKVFGVLTPESHRGKGFAPVLIEHFLAVAAQDAGACRAVLLARNDPACRCYRKMGFVEIGRFTTLERC